MEAIIKTNRLIAEFMGYEVINYQHNEYNPIYNDNKHAKTIGQLKTLFGGIDLQFTGRFVNAVKYPFDTDFNLLIPIIRRIEENGYVVKIAGISYQIYKVLDEQNPIISLVCGDKSKKTELTHDLLIQFIEWNNENKAII